MSLIWIWICFATALNAVPTSSTLSWKCTYFKLTKFMDCENVNLKYLDSDSYAVSIPDIKDLNLARNNIKMLEFNIFQNLTNVINLDLSYNFLSSLDYRLFTNMTNLKTLNLRYNRLRQLSDGRLFENQLKLGTLILDFNHITYINESVLKPLDSLQELFLTGNFLECNCDLQKTMLWCETKGLALSTRCGSPAKYKQISWTNLRFENCNETAEKMHIIDSRCNYTPTLGSLDCTNVPLRTVKNRDFPVNITFHNISLRNTSISTLNYDVFHLLTQLQFLDLSKNFLEKLDSRIFFSCSQLQRLILSENNILFLDDDIFKSQKNLKFLSLENNHLTHLSVKTLMPLTMLVSFDLSGNQFICDCDLMDAMRWCMERNLTKNVQCKNPHTYPYGFFSWRIAETFFECYHRTTTSPLTEVNTVTSATQTNDTQFSDNYVIILITISILFIVSVILMLWFHYRKGKVSQKPTETELYDDIDLEERGENTYEVIELAKDRKDRLYENSTFSSLQHGKSSNENLYEEIENMEKRNAKCASYLIPIGMHTSDSKTDQKNEKENAKSAPTYHNLERGSQTRKENIYVLK